MFKTRLGLAALGFSAVAFLFILLAFVTEAWLVTDGQIEPSKTKFENLGNMLLITFLYSITDFQKWGVEATVNFVFSWFFILGLWIVCFKHFEDPRHLYDTKFSDCWWFYEEEYYIIHEFLLPGKIFI